MLTGSLRGRNWFLTALAGALALLVGVTFVAYSRAAELDTAENALGGIYQKAFYETCELTQSMAVGLGKLSIAGGGAREAILTDITRQAQGAQSNLAVLPLGGAATASTIKFVNQTGDFCQSLLVKLSSGGDITDAEYATIAQLTQTAAELTLGLSELLDRYEAGESTFSGELADTESFLPITNPAAEYPTLLYDGPFSDGAADNEFLTLEGLSEVSLEDAQRVLQAYMGAESVDFEGESSVFEPCYEFSLAAGGYEMNAAVTKRGGKVLYVMCASEVAGEVKTAEECISAARAFLVSRGYGSMELSYYSTYDGVMTLNFAAVQANVVLYPDLVKVQVSMSDGAIIGVEAGNYLRNHIERIIEKPGITEEDALLRLSPRLTAHSARLCVIPVGSGEKLCYEINASSGDGAFLIYVDAATGDQIEIMSIVNDSTGKLVM